MTPHGLIAESREGEWDDDTSRPHHVFLASENRFVQAIPPTIAERTGQLTDSIIANGSQSFYRSRIGSSGTGLFVVEESDVLEDEFDDLRRKLEEAESRASFGCGRAS